MPRFDYSDFEIIRVVGTGTVGTIYEVKHRETGDTYALKLLAQHVCTDKLILARFRREILILSKLSHPHIVAYFGQGTHDQQLFYIMEFIRGGTLKELLARSGPLDWIETAECGRQLASALQYAHNHGVIHRDVKPGNVYLKRDGSLKLGDFGIARDELSTELTEVGLTVGTYHYMSPELVRGRREISGKSDLYALGCLLFELLTERPPYQGDNFAQIFEQHLNSTPPKASQFCECPPALENLILELLAKSPDDRPFNARTVQGVLTELLDEQGLDVEPAVNSGADRGASSVRRAQLSLAARIQISTAERVIAWWQLLLLLAGIVLAVFAATFFSGNG
jgi:serine/threonine protein kinase